MSRKYTPCQSLRGKPCPFYPVVGVRGRWGSTKVRAGLETGAVSLSQVLLRRTACVQGLQSASSAGLLGMETSQLRLELQIQTDLGSNPSFTIYLC